MPARDHTARRKLVLLVAPVADQRKDLVAATLSWMCREKDTLFDVYYAANRRDGGIFSPHGSLVLGGRHHSMLARALAQFETLVVRLDNVSVMDTLISAAAVHIVEAPASLAELYLEMADLLGVAVPRTAVAFQTEHLPAGLTHGMSELVATREGHKLAESEGVARRPAVVQYAFPEAVYRKALALPLETDAGDCAALRQAGVTTVWTVATAAADAAAWRESGMSVQPADTLADADDFGTLSLRVAQRWLDQATAVDMHEPLLASNWLPFSVRENRLQISAPEMAAASAALAKLTAATGQSFFYGRYGGGATRGAITDEDLFRRIPQRDLLRGGRAGPALADRVLAPAPAVATAAAGSVWRRAQRRRAAPVGRAGQDTGHAGLPLGRDVARRRQYQHHGPVGSLARSGRPGHALPALRLQPGMRGATADAAGRGRRARPVRAGAAQHWPGHSGRESVPAGSVWQH